MESRIWCRMGQFPEVLILVENRINAEDAACLLGLCYWWNRWRRQNLRSQLVALWRSAHEVGMVCVLAAGVCHTHRVRALLPHLRALNLVDILVARTPFV